MESSPLKDLKQALHGALKLWHKDSSAGSPLDHLPLFHRARQAGKSVRQASNQLLLEGLARLQTLHELDAQLLRQRFLDEQPIYTLAIQRNVAESTLYKVQNSALHRLAEVVQLMEQESRGQYSSEVEARLPAPSYQRLVGVERALAELRHRLLVPALPWLVAIEGLGGLGKSALADALLRQLLAEGSVTHVAWVSAQQSVFHLSGRIRQRDEPALTTNALVEALGTQLLGPLFAPALGSPSEALRILEHHLKQPHLIVIDNLETVRDVEVLLPLLRRLAAPTKFLLTSRESLFAEPDIYHFKVDELSEESAFRLVRQEAEWQNLHIPSDEALHALYRTVGGNPLALRLVIGLAHLYPLPAILAELTEVRGESAGQLYTFIYRWAWEHLDEQARRLLLVMPLVPEHGETMDYLLAVSQMPPEAMSLSLGRLLSLNLVDRRLDRYTIHQLTRTFLQEQVLQWLPRP